MLVILQILLMSLMFLATIAIVVWMAGALYYDVGRASVIGWLLILFWLATVSSLLLCWQPSWKPCATIGGLWALFLFWWFRQRPSLARNWSPNHAILAHIDMQGDLIRVDRVRNTQYRTLEDYTPKFETRSYHTSRLRGADVLITFWGSAWMCHPILIFDFGDDGRICFSIEVRYRVGQPFNLLSSLYRQQELTYIVCDECDAILKRTRHEKDHDCYLYRFQADRDAIWQLFQEYVDGVNGLALEPRWYNGLTANCTTTIYNQRQHAMAWNWHLMFNGKLDLALYQLQRLDQRLPFDELKRQSRINDIANRAPESDFGNSLRRELPGYRYDK